MLDVGMIGVTILFFAVGALYIVGCDRMQSGRNVP